MNNIKYRWILYAILFVIVATISIQVYWNYKNYLTNKQQLVNDVQLSLDNAVESYFANLAAKNTIAYAIESDDPTDLLTSNKKMDNILKAIRHKTKRFTKSDSLGFNFNEDISIFKGHDSDSIVGIIHNSHDSTTWKTRQISLEGTSHLDLDSIINLQDFRSLTTKVIISMTNDSLQLKNIDSLLNKELHRKQINIDYGITLQLPFKMKQELNSERINTNSLSVTSNSNYLPKESQLNLYFNNITKTVLKRSLSGILLSTLLILTVISCLFYLLKIIKNQKQLAEVKNDLISNITHEFKTPIATIGVAIESIKNFNVIDNKEKTKTYLDMSSNQLSKLNIMVEKLLETATLDSDSLNLKKNTYNIIEILNTIIEKHKIQTKKQIHFNTATESITANIDAFHFENAFNNILDNAIKYGGNSINIDVFQNPIAFTVSISDDGNTLTKANKGKIFEKFYRIPKGNTHDIKGFGIGLYYAKKIAEKHGGTIHLDIENSKTAFKISLPNV